MTRLQTALSTARTAWTVLAATPPRPGGTRDGRRIHTEDQLSLTRHTADTPATRPPNRQPD